MIQTDDIDPFGLDDGPIHLTSAADLQPHAMAFIKLSDIDLDHSTQVRANGTDPKLVRRYARDMRAGAQFPPIKIALIKVDGKDVVTLVDGWHRYHAALTIGPKGTVWAQMVDETDPDRLAWIAVQENRTHGQRLTKADFRGSFRAYVRADMHLEVKNGRRTRKVKAAFAMAKELEGICSRNTLVEWMRQDFPTTYAAMGRDKKEADEGEEPDWTPFQIKAAWENNRAAIEGVIASRRMLSKDPKVKADVVKLLIHALEQFDIGAADRARQKVPRKAALSARQVQRQGVDRAATQRPSIVEPMFPEDVGSGGLLRISRT